MRTLIAMRPLAGLDLRAGLVLLGFVLGFGIKTPLFPVHTWLPPAHVDAPGPASAILAGVLLKMGTYGLIRLPFSMMSETFTRYARSEEHTSELQSLMRTSYAVFCLKKKIT